jgi:hypothetical protein
MVPTHSQSIDLARRPRGWAWTELICVSTASPAKSHHRSRSLAAVPSKGQTHRDRHSGDRHALRESVLYGRGCGRGRPHRGRGTEVNSATPERSTAIRKSGRLTEPESMIVAESPTSRGAPGRCKAPAVIEPTIISSRVICSCFGAQAEPGNATGNAQIVIHPHQAGSGSQAERCDQVEAGHLKGLGAAFALRPLQPPAAVFPVETCSLISP